MALKVRRIDFSADEWLAGTHGLTAFDRGVFITICALIYSHGKRVQSGLVAQHCACHGNALNASLNRLVALHKIYRKGSEIGQKRCEKELENARKRSTNARENVAKRWKNNDIDDQPVLQARNANHQPSTTNHQLPEERARGRAQAASLNGKGKGRYVDPLDPRYLGEKWTPPRATPPKTPPPKR